MDLWSFQSIQLGSNPSVFLATAIMFVSSSSMRSNQPDPAISLFLISHMTVFMRRMHEAINDAHLSSASSLSSCLCLSTSFRNLWHSSTIISNSHISSASLLNDHASAYGEMSGTAFSGTGDSKTTIGLGCGVVQAVMQAIAIIAAIVFSFFFSFCFIGCFPV